MLRIATTNRVSNLHGAGKDGFRDGDLNSGIKPTEFSAAFANAMQEELLSSIEAAGLVPATANAQVIQAIRRLAGSNVTVVDATMSPFILTADHAGLVLINAVFGNVILNLPAANTVAGLPLAYDFKRIDSVPSTLATINCAAGNVIDGAAAFSLVGQWSSRSVRSNATSAWATVASSVFVASAAEAQAQTDNAKFITPLRLSDAFLGANQSMAVSGYQRHPGGIIEQWGVVSVPNSTPVTVIYPVSYISAVRSIVATFDAGGGTLGQHFTGGVGFAGLNSFVFSGFPSGSWCWRAIGK